MTGRKQMNAVTDTRASVAQGPVLVRSTGTRSRAAATRPGTMSASVTRSGQSRAAPKAAGTVTSVQTATVRAVGDVNRDAGRLDAEASVGDTLRPLSPRPCAVSSASGRFELTLGSDNGSAFTQPRVSRPASRAPDQPPPRRLPRPGVAGVHPVVVLKAQTALDPARGAAEIAQT